MIFITQSPLQAAQFAQAYPLNQLQHQMLQKMLNSRYPFMYRNAHELWFELQLRNEIVNSSYALNESGVSFEVFQTSFCNLAYWILDQRGGFRLRPSVRPSDAILNIFQQGELYGFECATGMVILLYRAVLEVLGPAVFNRLFTGLYVRDWQTDSDLRLSTGPTPEYLAGDIRYFDNPDVDPRVMHWQGENAVDLGNGLYYGHGMGIRPAHEIIELLNQHRRPGATRSAFLMRQVTLPGFRYLAQFSMPQRNHSYS